MASLCHSFTGFCCFLFADCFVNETTRVKTNETIQFTDLLDSFYVCVDNASQVWLSKV